MSRRAAGLQFRFKMECGTVLDGSFLQLFTMEINSVNLLSIRSGFTPNSSTGALLRLIQKTVKPKDFAPRASQQFDETNPMLRGSWILNLSTASWYTLGLGLKMPASSTLMTYLSKLSMPE